MTRPTATGPLARYEVLLATGQLAADPAQRRASERLEALHRALVGYRPAVPKPHSLTSRLFGRLSSGAPNPTRPRGLYIWGDVGRGKSMLMDLFFQTSSVERKRRVHFHAFMQEVHDRLHRLRGQKLQDPLLTLAGEIAASAWLLCFDEFLVSDIADAMILGRLFEALFREGVVVVATSNRAPDALYEGGLHRERFLPFIETLKSELDVLELEIGRDYRLARLAGRPVYYSPLDGAARAALEALFLTLSGGDAGGPLDIEVKKRRMRIPRAAGRAAWFGFRDLCGQALGAVDYLAIAERFDDIILSDIPRLGPDRRDEARRFNTLIDVLYEAKIRLIASAEALPQHLYVEGDGSFEFARTVSRLMEMQSSEYLTDSRTIPERGEGLQVGALVASGVSR